MDKETFFSIPNELCWFCRENVIYGNCECKRDIFDLSFKAPSPTKGLSCKEKFMSEKKFMCVRKDIQSYKKIDYFGIVMGMPEIAYETELSMTPFKYRMKNIRKLFRQKTPNQTLPSFLKSVQVDYLYELKSFFFNAPLYQYKKLNQVINRYVYLINDELCRRNDLLL